MCIYTIQVGVEVILQMAGVHQANSSDKNILKKSIEELCIETQHKCHQKLQQDIFEFPIFNEDGIKVAFIQPNNTDKFEWISFDSLMKSYDNIWKGLKIEDIDKKSEYTWFVAEAIHSLADKLPAIGNDNIELFGALARLHFWHNAVIRINSSESNKERLLDWKDMLYTCDDEIKTGIELWRGYICLGKQTSEGPYLPYFNLVAPLHEKCDCGTLKPVEMRKTATRFTSSRRKKLHPIRIHRNPRFPYRHGTDWEVNKPPRSWFQTKSTYNPHLPRLEKDLKGSKYLHFLVYYDNSQLVAQLLCIPESFDPNFFVPSHSSVQSSEPSTSNEDIVEILKNLPCMFSDLLLDIHNLVSEAQEVALDIFEKKYTEIGIDKNAKDSAIVTLMELVKEAIIQNLIEENVIFPTTEFKGSSSKVLPILEYQRDQNDWPERQSLLQNSINDAKMKRYNSLDTLGGMEPPAEDSLTISLEAKDLLKNFRQSGEGKKEVEMKSFKLIPVAQRIDGRCPKLAPKTDAKNQMWPQALKNDCHGAHFNLDDNSELNQVECDKLKAQYLIDETGNTCSNFKNKHSKYLIVPKKEVSSSNLSQNVRRSPRKHHISQKKDYHSMPSTSTGRASKLLTRSNSLINPVQKKSVPDLKKSHSGLRDSHRMKLRCCVVDELEKYGITLKHPTFKECGKKLFAICRPFVNDLIGVRSITEEMRKICKSHVKQVMLPCCDIHIEFNVLLKIYTYMQNYTNF
ncbi:Mdm2-binding protein [Nymphon striatum]|nr:Mdm2-binding protein [Nymphon striatum]